MSNQIEQLFDVGITDQIFVGEDVDEMSLNPQKQTKNHTCSLTDLLIKVP